MLPTREYMYFGAVIGFIILGLAKGVSLYWALLGDVVGGVIGFVLWKVGEGRLG